MDFFYLLSPILGYAMEWLYNLVGSYGWAILIFTLIVRIVMFPLSLKQQKSQARTAAFQPMIKEIQAKWANDRTRQSQELQKFNEENNIKMSAGCAPMLVNMLVIFGIIGVVQAPLTYVLHLPPAELTEGYAIVQSYRPETNIQADLYTQQTLLADEVRGNPELFWKTGAEVEAGGTAQAPAASSSVSVPTTETGGGQAAATRTAIMTEPTVNAIAGFRFDLPFFGANMNLATVPDFSNFLSLLLPILSLLTMAGSQIVIMATSGQTQGRGTMIVTMLITGVMFGFFAFRVPIGFSLYYTFSNIVMTGQQLLVRKIYDPRKIREQVQREVEERRAAKKAKKKVVVTKENGEVVTDEMNEAELNRLRLARARELDRVRYSDEEPQNAPDTDGGGKRAKRAAEEDGARGAEAEKDAQPAPEEGEGPPADEAPAKPQPEAEYKAGRRRRARMNRDKGAQAPEEASFADAERASEDKP